MATDKNIELAKIAEQAERYKDMAEHMKKYVEETSANGEQIQTEHRNLLSVAYKNVVGAHRSAWRVLKSITQKRKTDSSTEQKETADNYLVTAANDVKSVCKEVTKLLDEHLLKDSSDKEDNSESRVFFLKMKGDYYRYLAEVVDPANDENERKEYVDASNEAYKSAMDTAKDKMKPTNPIRLGLALNYSVFHYEIQDKPTDACDLAKQAFDDAIAELDSLQEESYKDSTLIMQLLRDNLTLWSTNEDKEEDDENQ